MENLMEGMTFHEYTISETNQESKDAARQNQMVSLYYILIIYWYVSLSGMA